MCTCITCNDHFPGGPGLADTRISPFWILLELRMMKVVATAGAIRYAKLRSNRHQQQTTQLFTGLMPFLLPNQQCQNTEGKITFTCKWKITWSRSNYVDGRAKSSAWIYVRSFWP